MSQGYEIPPSLYTEDIIKCIEEIKYNMFQCGIDFTDDDIKVTGYGDTAYVLGNPVVKTEEILNDNGEVEKILPVYNITIIYDENWLESEIVVKDDAHYINYKVKPPHLRIIMPQFCKMVKYEPRI